MQDADLEAGNRLRDAVTEAYGRKPDIPQNPNQLSRVSGVARTTLTGYFERGVQPTVDNMRDIAAALQVPVESLWLRWLGYEVPDAGLSRIAKAIDDLRMAIVPEPPDEALLERQREAVRQAEEAAGLERLQSTSRRRRSDRPRGAERRRGSLEGEAG